jgi:tetratricopeptide (TPR) repeat protein
VVVVPSTICAQKVTPTDTQRGIELYDQGQYAEAIVPLKRAAKRNKHGPIAWHYLALSFEKTGNTAEALQAHKQAASATPEYFFNKYHVTKPSGLQRWFLEARPALSAAAASAVRVLELDANAKAHAPMWNDRINQLSEFATVFSRDEVTERADIFRKPTPQYTEEARQHDYSADVSVLVILAEDGTVKRIWPLGHLKYGLTEKAIAAAERIQFVPAKMNGKPVPQMVMAEYHFNIY